MAIKLTVHCISHQSTNIPVVPTLRLNRRKFSVPKIVGYQQLHGFQPTHQRHEKKGASP